MGGWTIPLEIAAGLALLLVLTAAWFTARRLWLARGAAFDCSLRLASARDGSRWTIGVARYEQGRIDWFRVFSPSLRPARTFERDLLEVTGHRVPAVPERHAVLPGSTVVGARYDGDDLELAMSGEAYTGLASWLEASPPGRTGQVT
ncbi:DUF2550 domain-containing protein [Angustibacter speluncae]